MRGGVRAPTVEVALLGGFRVRGGGVPAEPRWRLTKAKTLVKMLALAPGHRLHREIAGDLLWPDSDPRAVANNLHQVLHAARSVLGPTRIVLRDDVVVLGPDGDVEVDVDSFVAAATTAMATLDPSALGAALARYGGDVLPEDLYEDWTAAAREQVASLRAAAAVASATLLVEAGRPADAVAVLEPVARDRPLDEAVARGLIDALAAAGRRSDALAVFDAVAERLARELGVEPERGTVESRDAATAGRMPARSAKANLPAPTTSFVGRHRELAELEATLGRTRMLTLTGPGGAGKTRLAIELARRRASTGEHRDGVWLVELAGLGRGELVASEVALVLCVTLRAGEQWARSLAEQLAEREVLLVLDNCEHVLAPAAHVAEEVLARCARATVLATSREPLQIAGEVVWRVPSLELPARDGAAVTSAAAVQLFADRAGAVAPGFTVDSENAAAVAEICSRLDGIPLALELAAARVAHVSVDQLLDRLDDALTLLRRGGRRLDRQQTMAATLDWSHALLTDDEQVVFRRLSVFAGGFDLEAASTVCDVPDVFDPLARLVDKSLVISDTTGPAARYRLLEVVRQYAAAQLQIAGESDRCRTRHRRWYADEAERHDPDRGVPVVLEPSSWFDVEQDNLRTALSAATDADPDEALRLATATWRFFMSRGQIAEGVRWMEEALARSAEPSLLRARALFALAVLHIREGQNERLVPLRAAIAEVTSTTGDDIAAASGLEQAAVLSLLAPDWHGAADLSRASLARAPDAPTVVSCAAHFEAMTALGVGDTRRARRCLQRAVAAVDDVPLDAAPFFTALTLCWVLDDDAAIPMLVPEETLVLGRRVGAEQARAYIDVAAALTERIDGDMAGALLQLDDAASRFQAVGDTFGYAYALAQRAHALRRMRSLDEAIATFVHVEDLRRALRDERSIALTIGGRALARALAGDARLARADISTAVEMMRRSDDTPGIAITVALGVLVEFVFDEIDAATIQLEEVIAIGDRINPAHVFGWHHLLLAHLRHRQGDGCASHDAATAALAYFGELGDVRGEAAVQSARKAGRITLLADNP